METVLTEMDPNHSVLLSGALKSVTLQTKHFAWKTPVMASLVSSLGTL